MKDSDDYEAPTALSSAIVDAMKFITEEHLKKIRDRSLQSLL